MSVSGVTFGPEQLLGASATAADVDKLVGWFIQEEGERLHPYRDTSKHHYLTIGIGRNLDTTGISPQESRLLFLNDLTHATDTVRRLGRWTSLLDPVRWAALLAMAFQMGEDGLREFHATLAAMERRE